MELSGLGGVQRTVHVTDVPMFPALLPRLLVDFDDTSLLSGRQTDVLSSLLLLRASINL